MGLERWNDDRGTSAVIEICEGTLRELADTTTEFLSFVVIDGSDTVAVDAVGRYVDATGAATAVSSCDIFEFRGGLVHQITSYTVEIDPAVHGGDRSGSRAGEMSCRSSTRHSAVGYAGASLPTELRGLLRNVLRAPKGARSVTLPGQVGRCSEGAWGPDAPRRLAEWSG